MLQRPHPLVVAILLGLVVLTAALPILPDAWVGAYVVKFVTRVVCVAIMVISLDLLIGITGLVSFGHAAFFGLGAYVVFFCSPEADSANLLFALPAAVLVCGLVAAVMGSFVVRTRGFYFIMVTLAASQMLYAIFHDTKIAGGSDGGSINLKPAAMLGEFVLLDTSHRASLLWVALVCLVMTYVVCLALVRSSFGRVLQGIHANEERMSALGFDTYRYKWGIFVISAAMAGLAGALFACIDGFVPPELLSWRQSGLAIMMLVLGGVGTLYGSLFGALVYNVLEEVLKTPGIVGTLVSSHWPLVMGCVLIAAVLTAPRGLAGLLPAGLWSAADSQRRSSDKNTAHTQGAKTETSPVGTSLSVEGLSKVFGGLIANEGLTLTFAPHQIHAIIGPNGAGKTTFTNLLSGALQPTSGRIFLGPVEITTLPVHKRAQLGVGRSFQRTNIVSTFRVLENCRIAAEASGQGEAAVQTALVATDLGDLQDRPAHALSHGQQRQLEIAMLLAGKSDILLLDEPLAGAGPEETKKLSSLLRRLAAHHTIVIVEHDMDAVFAVADTISVLVNGRLLAHGTPQEIRQNGAVIDAYLGHSAPQEVAA